MSSEQPAGEVLRAIERVDAKPARVAIPAVSLIEMHRDRNMYEWRTLEMVLTGHASWDIGVDSSQWRRTPTNLREHTMHQGSIDRLEALGR